MFRAAVIDDEQAHRDYFVKHMNKILGNIPHSVKSYSSPREFLQEENSLDTLDLILTDIHFEQENGIDFIRELHQVNPHIDVVFMSSHLDYAPKVYDVEHISFIYKRDIQKNLKSAIQKALVRADEKKTGFLHIRWKNTAYQIPIKDITYIEKDLRRTNVHTLNGDYTTYTKMEELLDILGDRFLRVHFSYAVSKNHVSNFGPEGLYLSGGQFIPVSRTYSKSVKDYVSRLFENQEKAAETNQKKNPVQKLGGS